MKVLNIGSLNLDYVYQVEHFVQPGETLWQLAKEKKAGALITADVKHNIFIEAAEVGFALLDAGHFNTENVVVKNICEYLSNEISGVDFFEYDLKEIKTV